MGIFPEERRIPMVFSGSSHTPRFRTFPLLTLAVLVALATGLNLPLTAAANPPNSVSGEAYGVFAHVETAAATVTIGKTPRVVLPPEGGMDEEQVASLSIPGVVASETLTVITSGAIGAEAASAQSSATVEQVDILNGLVTASLVVAMSSSTGDGSTATSSAEGSTLLDLTVNGVFMGDVTPAPNTTIGIPGVATVILNEQIAGGDGVRTTTLTVNMIHVVLNGAASGEIIVASAHSDVDFTPGPGPGREFMTGGGRLGTGREIATFGFNAGPRDGVLRGQLQYIDHAQGLNVHATSIDSFSTIPETPCVSFSGPARVNGVDGFSVTVDEACDHGEPGVGRDTLAIAVSGPGLSYSRSGVLTGGNLQLHLP